MIRAEVALPRHVATIRPRLIFQADTSIRSRVSVGIYTDKSRAFVADNGQVLAIVGATLLWPGVYEFWGFTSDIPNKYKVQFARLLLEHLTFFCIDNNVKRAQMVVREGYFAEMKFAEHLGFQREGLMRCYGPEGASYYMYGRVF